MSSTKLFTVDKFLGLNESADSATELKMGEAAKAENFYITDGYNIRRRPGAKRLAQYSGELLGLRTGKNNESEWMLVASRFGDTVHFLRANKNYTSVKCYEFYNIDLQYPVKFFDYGDATYVVGKDDEDQPFVAVHCNGEIREITAYIPLWITGANPDGNGTEVERLSLLSPYFRMQFSADGESTEYRLPSIVNGFQYITVDGMELSGEDVTYDGKSVIFAEAPAKGVNNIEICCYILTYDEDYHAAFLKFCSMKHCEAYNGVTDTRLFFYGDGTNICYYTETPMDGGDGLYLPLGNEIRFDMSPTPVTGMCRHGTQLMVYQQDCASTVVYEPITLADGRITSGFYVRPASRAVGNEMDAQVQTVNNYPRTLCGGSLYEWRNSASYYRDERYAKQISEKVVNTLAKATPMNIVTCDDNANKTYYMFLNDEIGTVLVNRYDLDAWTMYTGEVFKGIRYAQICGNQMLFANQNTVFCLDEAADFDDPIAEDGEATPILAVWESGFMDFGAGYLKKYASRIWLSLLPESNSELDITVRTDKRDDYITKAASYSFLDFSKIDFSRFSFVPRQAPTVKRIQIKVKKFIYYKLIFRVSTPGCRATVLGYEQQVRFSSPVK